jgi:hypothetical protein
MELQKIRIKNYLRKRALPQIPPESGNWSSQVSANRLVAAVEQSVEHFSKRDLRAAWGPISTQD